MCSGDAATWVGSLATAITGGFTAWQLFLLRRQSVEERRIANDGVAVSWHGNVDEHDPSGIDTWQYVFQVSNPGRLPIKNVNVTITFPISVVRVHVDGRTDEASTALGLGQAVLVGGGDREWKRTLRIRRSDRALLREVAASVSFVDMNGRKHENRWRGGGPA